MTKLSPEFRVWLHTRTAFDSQERASELMDYITAHQRFAPDRFGAYEPLRRLTKDKTPAAIELLVNGTAQLLQPDRVMSMLLLERSRAPVCSYRICWSRLPHVAFEVSSYSIEEKYLHDKEVLADWLDFTFGLINMHEAWYAIFALGSETHDKNFLTWHVQDSQAVDPERGVTTARGVGLDLTEGIPGVYWGNYFGPFYTEWFGQEKFEALPCAEKHWLDRGGIFFTTAPTPFDWNTLESHRLQQAAKDHLGPDAFFDINAVRRILSSLEPIPDNIKPEQLQGSRRVPVFPFEITPPPNKPLNVQVEEARRYFEGQGFTFESFEQGVLTFRDATGGITRIALKPERRIEYWPKQ